MTQGIFSEYLLYVIKAENDKSLEVSWKDEIVASSR